MFTVPTVSDGSTELWQECEEQCAWGLIAGEGCAVSEGMHLTVEQKVVHDELVKGSVCAGTGTVVDNGQGVVNGECIQALVALLVTTGLVQQ